MGMLKEMDIFVRSHLTPLKDEQVSLMRARWEHDQRKHKQPSTPPKRRRAAKAVEPAPVPEPVAVADSRPKRRRRTAAEVAAAEAAAAEVARLALETAAREQEEVRSAASLEERAAALFKDLAPPSPAVEVAE